MKRSINEAKPVCTYHGNSNPTKSPPVNLNQTALNCGGHYLRVSSVWVGVVTQMHLSPLDFIGIVRAAQLVYF